MDNLTGVEFCKKDKYAVFIINELSEDIKESIRKELALICHGADYVKTGRRTYSYKDTVREFLTRYENKTEDIKLGMMGELLIHLLISYYFKEYKSVTPYFNMEERSVTKGYDAVVTEAGAPILWIVEVKSGLLHLGKNSNQTMSDLIGTAKGDLNRRLNEDNRSLWLEAINGAKISFDSNDNMKDAVMNLLYDWSDDAQADIYTSSDKNVILSGVLFADVTDKIAEENVKRKQEAIEKNEEFNKVFVLSVQKSTYEAIYNFLREEASHEEQ